MRTAIVLLVLAVVSSSAVAKPKNRFTRYPSWNTRMYPIWKDGDPRCQDSWKGGKPTFDVGNDAPTLTGAKVTFTIDLVFPHNQRVLPNGEVVWAETCIINGTKYGESEPVYPSQNIEVDGVFPDGTPFKKDKPPSYVFVWKAWGKYWQVSDGPSSSLTISTDDIPLGSYTVDIVIYHYRSKEKFIPLGYASTQFSITDQIPFAVTMKQVNDLDEADLRFVQNRAIAFSITLHDPSGYLGNADTTFNWDFGDDSGALISRDVTVTHTYISSGAFKPQVVIQAVIPDKACDPPVNTPTQPPGPPSDQGTTGGPANASPALVVLSTELTSVSVNMGPSDSEEDPTEEEASTQATQDSAMLAKTPSPINSDMATVPVGSAVPEAVLQKAKNGGAVILTGHATMVVAKRDSGDKPSDDDCVIYRYGSYCTGIDVVEGIESVNIVHMENAIVSTSEAVKNVVDLTITCQGSRPKEVCSVILDAECLKPIHTVCNMVEPSLECQLVLRHFFNDSGVYCINVSMTNEVSLAVTSAKVNVSVGPNLSSSGTIAMVLGVLAVTLAVGTVAYSYKRFKSYHPLKEDLGAAAPQVSHARTCSGTGTLWKLLGRKGAVDNCPLLQDGRV
ncbi:premelanosome protein b [Aplochiton taeniatus]